MYGARGGFVTGGGTFGLKSGGSEVRLVRLGGSVVGRRGLLGVGEASGVEESEEGFGEGSVVERSKRVSTLFSIEASLSRMDLISPSSFSSSSFLGGRGSTVSAFRTSLRTSICKRDSSVLLEEGILGVVEGIGE